MTEAQNNKGGIESLVSQSPPQPRDHPLRDIGRELYDNHEIIENIDAGAEIGDLVERYAPTQAIEQLPIDERSKESLISKVNSVLHTYASLLVSGHKQLSGAKKLLDEERLAHNQTKDKSSIDFLTGLPLREKMDNETNRELERLVKRGSIGPGIKKVPKLSYLMFDIDHFKKINDTYGHAAGDVVLANFAKILKESEIYVARVGGEEFTGIARAYSDIPRHLETTAIKKGNQSQIVTGRSIAEKIRSAVEQHKFVYQHENKDIQIPVTVSIGVTGYSPEQDSKKQLDDIKNALKKRADDALYLAKENGRNRVMVYGDNPDHLGEPKERYGLWDSLVVAYKAGKAAHGTRRK